MSAVLDRALHDVYPDRAADCERNDAAMRASLRFGSGDIGVVFFAGNGRSTEQCKADARLIAAAPELLEAAMAFVKPFEGVEMVKGSAVDLARAAIAKATGEAP